jgi:hypothetical protein
MGLVAGEQTLMISFSLSLALFVFDGVSFWFSSPFDTGRKKRSKMPSACRDPEVLVRAYD